MNSGVYFLLRTFFTRCRWASIPCASMLRTRRAVAFLAGGGFVLFMAGLFVRSNLPLRSLDMGFELTNHLSIPECSTFHTDGCVVLFHPGGQ